MLHYTKSSVIDCLEQVLNLKKLQNVDLAKRSTQRKKSSRNDLGALLFLKLEELVVLCDREAVIEPSKTNTDALIAVAWAFCQYFKEVVCRLPNQPDWDQLALKQKFSDLSFTLSGSIICPDRLTLEEARGDMREHADEQQRITERARRVSELIDIQTDVPEEEKEMTLDDAVLVIQKLERMYQAVSRYNYLRHVYQRAMDVREEGATMTDEEAIIKIQARTRGYFARKKVKEMRQKELDILGMSTRSLLDSMKLNVQISEALPFTNSSITPLDSLLDKLKSNFFPPVVPEKEELRLLQRKADTENLYHQLFLKRLIKKQKSPKLTMNELATTITVDGKTFNFDLRLFLNCSILIPLALRGWYHKTDKRWLLLDGEEGSGKTVWVEAVAAATGAVHLRISAANLARVRRQIVNTIIRYVRADSCVIVTVDRLEVFKSSKRTTTASQNLLKILLFELHTTNVILIGMTRSLELQPQILSMFTDIARLKPLRETRKTEVVARILVNLEDIGRLPRVPENLNDLLKETKGLTCGKTGKVVRSKWSRAANNNN